MKLQPLTRALLVGTVCVAVACSKPAVPPPDTAPARAQTAQPAPGQSRRPPPAITNVSATAIVPSSDPEEEAAAQALEIKYLESKDLSQKLTVLSELTDTDPLAALPVMGRLFYLETDLDMKEEILTALTDVDGAVEQKLELLGEAIQTNQPSRIRLAAIDALLDLGERRGALVLQEFVSDPDPAVRQAAESALEDLLETP